MRGKVRTLMPGGTLTFVRRSEDSRLAASVQAEAKTNIPGATVCTRLHPPTTGIEKRAIASTETPVPLVHNDLCLQLTRLAYAFGTTSHAVALWLRRLPLIHVASVEG